ncbi:hypothetical protein ATE84_1443 [Aquimarina sp. MAR_2010_214]|uniref:hypothetical protein n=1 Tax=Aquimarina sp. MAR_2010_214 TaxID=1250026 RepID=UPI000C70F089|nr:hypothetical protein [Aquimarina sp. MAR_2010_214]PKV49419.1 hypothetical protein ATE84_1443 [Aquimarina sp. MAR_2010_214]
MKSSNKQHNFQVITTYQDQVVENNTLRLDFDTISSATIHLEITDAYIKNDPSLFEQIEWVIIENNIRVDEDDYTGGQKAELKLYKEQAGAHDAPSYIDIQVVHLYKGIVDTVRIELVATPRITEASWVDPDTLDTITETKFNTFVGIELNGEAIQGIPLTVDVCLEDNDQIIDHFTATKDRSLYNIELNKKWHARHHIFFSVVKKTYLIISYLGHDGTRVIYNGKEQNNLLTIDGKKISREPLVVPETLMNVTVGTDPYFTQRYEPCKYQTISYTFAEQPTVTIFEESDQSTDTPHRQPNIAVQVGAHKKPLVIEVSGHNEDTKCSAVERGEEAHSKRIINIEEIPEKYITQYEGNKVSFTPYYPYKYLDDNQKVKQSNYLDFLWDYFIPPNTTELSIPIETCRYAKNVAVEIAPDIAWAAHFQLMLDPSQLEKKPDALEIAHKKEMYFREIDAITLHKGIDNLIEKYRPEIEKISGFFILPYIPSVAPFSSIKEFIASVMLDYIKGLGSCMGIGIHTYYNEDGENREIISYTDRYPQIGNVIFSVIIAIIVIVDILILIFSGGSSAAARLGFKVSAKTIRGAKAIQRIEDVYDKIERKTEHSVFEVAWPIITRSIGKGYKVYPDGSSGYNYELKLSANPIFGLMARIEGHIGDTILTVTGVSSIFSMARTGIGWWGKFKRLKRFKNNKELAKRAFKIERSKGKNVVSSGIKGAKALNKKGHRKLISPGDIIIILNRMENNLADKAKKYAKELGQELEYYLSIEGVYKAQFTVDFNIPDDGIPVIEMKNKLPSGEIATSSLDNNKKTVSYSRKKSIDAFAFVKVNSKFTFTTDWIEPYIPEWLGVKESDYKKGQAKTRMGVDGNVEAMLQGGISFERKYGIDNDLNPYYQDITHFSGIAGRYSYSLKKDEKDENDWEDEEEKNSENKDKKSFELKGENPQLVLMEPFDIESKKVYLFKQEDLTKGI